MHPVLWLALAIGSEVAATTALKLSDGFRNWGWGAVVVIGAPPATSFGPRKSLTRVSTSWLIEMLLLSQNAFSRS